MKRSGRFAGRGGKREAFSKLTDDPPLEFYRILAPGDEIQAALPQTITHKDKSVSPDVDCIIQRPGGKFESIRSVRPHQNGYILGAHLVPFLPLTFGIKERQDAAFDFPGKVQNLLLAFDDRYII